MDIINILPKYIIFAICNNLDKPSLFNLKCVNKHINNHLSKYIINKYVLVLDKIDVNNITDYYKGANKLAIYVKEMYQTLVPNTNNKSIIKSALESLCSLFKVPTYNPIDNILRNNYKHVTKLYVHNVRTLKSLNFLTYMFNLEYLEINIVWPITINVYGKHPLSLKHLIFKGATRSYADEFTVKGNLHLLSNVETLQLDTRLRNSLNYLRGATPKLNKLCIGFMGSEHIDHTRFFKSCPNITILKVIKESCTNCRYLEDISKCFSNLTYLSIGMQIAGFWESCMEELIINNPNITRLKLCETHNYVGNILKSSKISRLTIPDVLMHFCIINGPHYSVDTLKITDCKHYDNEILYTTFPNLKKVTFGLSKN